MEFIQISKEHYTNILVNMLFNWNENKMHPHAIFVNELVKHSDHLGRLLRPEIIPILKEELKLNDALIRKTLNLLIKKNHIRIKGVTIYLHPKYKIAKNCDPKYGGDGLFVICSTE